ncbi:protein suppressor of hairy wing isoform X2 [Ischnura elegans]|uniref:protein suppressor of hairy wing isoform X2 n=1 Tax=Ischnura elegans TaxID=197161 RepID=UPI001ED8B343|nr:protein suppressor of hairy wing isoform X2 [Ischnura elegans]
MAEKRKMPGEKRSSSVGKALLTPTRSSPRNKGNNAESAPSGRLTAKGKKTLMDHFQPVPKPAKRQQAQPQVEEPVGKKRTGPQVEEAVGRKKPGLQVEEAVGKKRPGPKVEESVGKKKSGPQVEEATDKKKAEPQVEEVVVKKRPGRKPGQSKKTPSAEAPSTPEVATPVAAPEAAESKQEEASAAEKKKGQVNGGYENIIWVKCEGNKNSRGGSAKKATKDAVDSSVDDGPDLTYPGDLKCDSCQRTFSNSSGFKRHLKFCLDAEGPPVIMKMKKPSPPVSKKKASIEDEGGKGTRQGKLDAFGFVGAKGRRRSKGGEERREDREDDDPDDELGEESSEEGEGTLTLSDLEQMHEDEEEEEGGKEPTEKSLREKMKDVMLVKVNELIDETSAMAPGKCHCCGEDLETAHSGGEFECGECGKHFKLRASLERHRRVIHLQGETHACPECDARCPDKGSLARHMYTHTGLKPYSCVRCKKQFSRKYHLERHIVQTGCDGNPKPTYPCQVCGRMFSRKDNLREHLRAHAGQVKRKKKYSCEYCLKEFHGTSLLRIHVRTHTGERPFVCDFCEKGFPSSGAMKKHRRMHTGERPYECKDCFAKFSAKETLNRHARTHTGLKPHVCNYCGKSFIQASQLRAHVFHHTAEEAEAHKCPICEKSFAMKSSLKIHLLTHTKEPPRSCDECGRAFIRQDCLLRHMRSKHREMLEEILAEAEKKKLQQQLLAATAMASRIVVRGERSRTTHLRSGEEDLEEEDEDEMDDVPEAGAIDRVLGMTGSDGAKAGALLQHLTAMGEATGSSAVPRMEASSSSSGARLGPSHHQGGGLSETALADSVRELLTLLVDDATLRAFGWPDAPVDKLLEAVIRRCGHQPASPEDYSRPSDRLRENAKLLFTVVIDDSAVKTLLNNQTVDEVILHVLRLAKS